MSSEAFNLLEHKIYSSLSKEINQYQLYKEKDFIDRRFRILTDENDDYRSEYSSHWFKVYSFGVDNAKKCIEAVSQLCDNECVRLSIERTFKWIRKDEGRNCCQLGWGIFALPCSEPYKHHDLCWKSYLPPYSDERFEYSFILDSFTNYSYHFHYINDDYYCTFSVHSKECLEAAKKIFPEFQQSISGNGKSGYKLVVKLT